MVHSFTEFKRAGESVITWLKKEYAGIRSGRAMPSILDGILVDVYDSKMPINQISSILATGPKSLLITSWDKNAAPSIDKAIRESNLGLSVSLDGQGVRVSFPELTSERRTMFVRAVKDKLEEARIKVRVEREKTLDNLDKEEESGDIAEDDKFRLKNELQRLVDDLNQRLDELASKKEKEILE